MTMERVIMKRIHYCHNPDTEVLIDILEDIETNNDDINIWALLKRAIDKTFLENVLYNYQIIADNIKEILGLEN